MAKSGARVQAGSVRGTVMYMDTAKTSLQQAMSVMLERAGDILYLQVRANLSLTDHSLADLAAMDHPYAKRHPRIKIHQGNLKFITKGEDRVHTRTGELLRSLVRGLKGPDMLRIEFNTVTAPHAYDVVNGTKVMHPRDPIWSTATAKGTQKAMMKAMVKAMGKELRTKAGLRFGPMEQL